MFCKNCGNKLNEGDKFCRTCGCAVNTDTIEKTQFKIISNHFFNSPNINSTNKPLTFRNIPVIWKVFGSIICTVIGICIIVYIVNIYFNDTYDDYLNNHVENEYDNNSAAQLEWIVEPNLQTSYPLAPYSYDLADKTITGTIKNISNETYSYVSIEFIIYDSSGTQLGTALDSIDNFKGGNTWTFEASALLDMSKVSSFEFLKITTR